MSWSPGEGVQPGEGGLPAPGQVRLSDREREAAVERLRVACAEGRLTFEELAERTGAVYAARVRAELAPLLGDLPEASAGRPPSPPAMPPAPPGPAERRAVAVLGDSKLAGRFVVDGPISAVAVLGDVTIDLRGAVVTEGVVHIRATAVLGDVRVLVPPGTVVELSGTALLGDKKAEVQAGDPSGRLPVVRVHGTAVLGDVVVRSPRESTSWSRFLGGTWDRPEDPRQLPPSVRGP